ncbi:MAG TPA: hypothetical protein VF062_27770 [Candidatus Limnocylindrales bacterium]
MTHVPMEMLRRYAAGSTAAATQWVIEAHLEKCGACRERLGVSIDPATMLLLQRVREGLDVAIAKSPRTRMRKQLPLWARWWMAPALLPRLGMTFMVALAATILDLIEAGGNPSVVLLLAPVTPLIAVAAVWSRGLDPAHELVVASPRAGLDLVLRRTLAVLAVVIPVLAVAGWVVGVSPVLWLLPCLVFTASALALGEFIGLHRAALGLLLGWTVVVIGPSLALLRLPAVLSPKSVPLWTVLTVLAVIVLIVRRHAYKAWASSR